MRFSFIKVLTLWTAILLAVGFSLQAQQITGTLTGTVADSTGAVVPGANVTMKNELSGDIRRTVTNNDGFFAINAVQPGDYTVVIESKGFEKYSEANVHFDAGDKRNLSNISLTVGSSSVTVTVTGEAEQVTPTDSGEKSAVIGQKTLQNVGIVGRNAADFIKILPGFAYNGGATNTAYTGEVQGVGAGPVGNFSANGGRNDTLDITSDGAHVIDPGCNCGQAVNTNSDMTAELKVLTSNFGAENQKGPVVIAAVGKSGGNAFHGEAYLYARNAVMNANDAFNNEQGFNAVTGAKLAPRPDTSYYYPGGQIGGPVLIPGTKFNKNRDKLFFFVAYEYYKQQVDNQTYTSTVPTAQMHKGDFSQLLTGNGYFGSTAGSVSGVSGINASKFPGGMIPASTFNPVGLAMLNFYPLPNADPSVNNGNNYISNGTKPQNDYQFRPRADYSISDRTKLYVSYNRERGNSEYTDTLWWRPSPTVPWPTDIKAANQSDSISANLTHVFSPTMTNEFVFTWTRLNLPFSFADPSKVDPAKTGTSYQHIFANNVAANTEIPSITGWGSGVANLLQPSGYQSGSLYALKTLPTVADNFSKVWGTHTVKAGFYWEATSNTQPSDSYANGLFIISAWAGSNSTGNAYADLLQGNLTQYQENNKDPIQRLAYKSADFYAQDSWKVSRRLTLDYGMRFQHLGAWNDVSGNGFAIFSPSAYSATSSNPLSGYEWCKITPSVPCSGSGSRFLFYNPRVGFAYDAFGTGKTVLRGGFGIYHSHDSQNTQAPAVTVSQGQIGFTEGSAINISQIGNINTGTLYPSVSAVVTSGDTHQPRTMSYSFSIAQRLPWSSLFEISYVGNKADYLASSGGYNTINTIPYGALFANNGAVFTAAGGNSPSASQLSAFRAYPTYGTFNEVNHNYYSNYNSLQASWNKQAGKLNVLTNYTFSKNLGTRGAGNGPNTDLLSLAQMYGVTSNDRTHVFNATYIYQFGSPLKGNKYLGAVANGWQVSGITQFQSGPPLQDSFSLNFGLSGNFPAGTVLPGGLVSTTANPIGINTDIINGSDQGIAAPVLTCDPRNGVTKNQFINPNCLAEPTPGHNGSINLPYLKGPAFFNSDLSLFKNFQFSEARKLQFRIDGFNFLNHPLTSFTNGDNNLNLNFGTNGKVSNPLFGTATSLQGHRVVQLALKFYF